MAVPWSVPESSVVVSSVVVSSEVVSSVESSSVESSSVLPWSPVKPSSVGWRLSWSGGRSSSLSLSWWESGGWSSLSSEAKSW